MQISHNNNREVECPTYYKLESAGQAMRAVRCESFDRSTVITTIHLDIKLLNDRSTILCWNGNQNKSTDYFAGQIVWESNFILSLKHRETNLHNLEHPFSDSRAFGYIIPHATGSTFPYPMEITKDTPDQHAVIWNTMSSIISHNSWRSYLDFIYIKINSLYKYYYDCMISSWSNWALPC